MNVADAKPASAEDAGMDPKAVRRIPTPPSLILDPKRDLRPMSGQPSGRLHVAMPRLLRAGLVIGWVAGVAAMLFALMVSALAGVLLPFLGVVLALCGAIWWWRRRMAWHEARAAHIAALRWG